MEPEDTLQCSQEPAICLYPEPAECRPNTPILFSKTHFTIIHTLSYSFTNIKIICELRIYKKKLKKTLSIK